MLNKKHKLGRKQEGDTLGYLLLYNILLLGSCVWLDRQTDGQNVADTSLIGIIDMHVFGALEGYILYSLLTLPVGKIHVDT